MARNGWWNSALEGLRITGTDHRRWLCGLFALAVDPDAPERATARFRRSGCALFENAEPLSRALRELLTPAARLAHDDIGLIGDLYGALDPGSRRRTGRYYTPKRIVELALAQVDLSAGLVMDPACGGGRFLLGALSAGVPVERLCGLDLDPLAVQICEASLFVAAGLPEIWAPPRLRIGDALLALARARGQHQTGLWLDEGQITTVIGNPPYRGGRSSAFAAAAKIYRQAFEVAEYQLDPYPLFIELALYLLRPGGQTALLVPNAWLSNLRNRKLRRLVLGQNALVRTIELPRGTFDAGVETHICVIERGGIQQPEVPVSRLGANGLEPTGVLLVDPADVERPAPLVGSAKIRALVETSVTWPTRLSDVAEVVRGVNPYHHTLHSRAEIAGRVHHSTTRQSPRHRAELRGRDVLSYAIRWPGDRFVDYGPHLKEPRKPRYFEGPRLVVRKILGPTLLAAYTDAPYVCDQSVYIVLPRPECPWHLNLLLACVSSQLVADLLRARCQEHDALFPQVKLAELRALPLPPIDPQEARALAVGHAAMAHQDATSGGVASQDLVAQRARLESAVARLYGLPSGDW